MSFSTNDFEPLEEKCNNIIYSSFKLQQQNFIRKQFFFFTIISTRFGSLAKLSSGYSLYKIED